MTPEIGKKYNTRSGRIAYVAQSAKHPTYLFAGTIEGREGFSCTWTVDGCAWFGQIDEYDLISEVHSITVEEMPQSSHSINEGVLAGTVVTGLHPTWNFNELVRLQKAVQAAGAELDAAHTALKNLNPETSVDDITVLQVNFDIAGKRFSRANREYQEELDKI
jgi:hypothetical protein